MVSVDKANLARIRDNQRRSRARHKEYVAELETRLRRFERQGAEAACEIQQVARRVADDNKKMRALLNRMGFDNERITSFLRSGSFDFTEAQFSNLSQEQEDMVQSLESLLASHCLGRHDSQPDTPSPTTCSVMYNSIESNASYSTYSQGGLEAHDMAVYDSMKLHERSLSNANLLGFGSQDYSHCSTSSIPTDNSWDKQLEHSLGVLEQNDNFQLGQAFQYDTNLNCQDIVHDENNPIMSQLLGGASRICSPSAPGDPSYSIPVGSMIQDPLYQCGGLSYYAFTG
ncbi:hypothetical protein F4776DRAFT_671161 [Hypoxylon sp. NC0597]|nr:hypothetical protein F4776DRAFT_671161 [Hypoxylon sp. NC0597]